MATNLTISFQEEHITPESLARALGIKPAAMLEDLKGERGIFADCLELKTILAWDTVERACKRAGFTAVDAWKETPKLALSDTEKTILKDCAKFHNDYAGFLEESGRTLDPEAANHLAASHKKFSQAIQEVLAKTLPKTRQQTAGPEI